MFHNLFHTSAMSVQGDFVQSVWQNNKHLTLVLYCYICLYFISYCSYFIIVSMLCLSHVVCIIFMLGIDCCEWFATNENKYLFVTSVCKCLIGTF